jgi:hypothetical protein
VRRRTLVLAIALGTAAAACGGRSGAGPSEDRPPAATAASVPPTSALPRGAEPVTLDPARFTGRIDHPYWPMRPGSRWVYRETDADGAELRVEVNVTRGTKRVAGIEATVVHDVVSEDGQLVEDTFDWYAQDAQGNVWYLGEDTKEYEHGKVTTTEGSWQAGVDGAQPGVLLPARPAPGMAYRQEYYRGKAEDAAKVLRLDQRVEVPYGSFDRVLQTEDTTPLEPGLRERKSYAPGVGPVLAVTVAGGSSREELLSFERGP